MKGPEEETPILVKDHNKQVYDAPRRDAVRPEIGDKDLQCEYTYHYFFIAFISLRHSYIF